MQGSNTLSLQVSEIIKQFNEEDLIVNEEFQRHSVWTPAAKTYFIDTVLHNLPIPKIYLRTKVDVKTKTTIKEIVDGQQRIRTLIEFANDEFKLTKRSTKFSGNKYSSLSDELKEVFLAYTITADQLIGASDDDVIDLFARLNSYTVSLNAAEKRHAEYQTEFKYAVRETSSSLLWFWEKYSVFTTRQRFRMYDDAFTAEMFAIFIEGVLDGGAQKITSFYKKQNDEVFTASTSKDVSSRITSTLKFFDKELSNELYGVFSKPYHLLMMVAAYAHNRYGILKGQLKVLPARGKLDSPSNIRAKLSYLNNALGMAEDAPARYKDYIKATESTTQRIASRRILFREYLRVFTAK